jgi:hypothetical protein
MVQDLQLGDWHILCIYPLEPRILDLDSEPCPRATALAKKEREQFMILSKLFIVFI